MPVNQPGVEKLKSLLKTNPELKTALAAAIKRS